MLDRYLRELKRHARRTLASRQIDALLGDAREHLEEFIQARLELGDPPEIAEQEAITAFGGARDLVQGANAAHRARFQGTFLGLTTIAGLGWAFAILASPVIGSGVVVVTGLTFFVFLGAFVEASKVRRSVTLPVIATVVFWTAFTLMYAWWTHDPSIAGWLSPHTDGPLDLPRVAFHAGVAAFTFFAYLVLAYRVARRVRRIHV